MAGLTEITNDGLVFLRDKAINQQIIKKPLLSSWQERGEKSIKKIAAGTSYDLVLSTKSHYEGVELTAETTTVPVTFKQIDVRASFPWSMMHYDVLIGDLAKALNQGQPVSIWEDRMNDVLDVGMGDLECKAAFNGKYRADSTSVKYGTMTTLNGTAAGLGSATGLFEGLAYGSQTNTVGGVSKVNNPSYQHHFQSAGGAFGTSRAGVRALESLIIDAGQFGGAPHLNLFSRNGLLNLRTQLEGTNELYVGTSKVKDFIAPDIKFMGIPCKSSFQLANTGGSTVNQITAYVLNLDDIHLAVLKNYWFAVSGKVDGLMSQFAGEGCKIQTTVALGALRLNTSGLLGYGDTY